VTKWPRLWVAQARGRTKGRFSIRDRYHAWDVIWTMNQAGADPSGPLPRAAVDIVCLALLPDDDPTDSTNGIGRW
jgi:hypothetical protein